MNTSFTIRLASFAISTIVSLAVVWMLADYAYPPVPTIQLASAGR